MATLLSSIPTNISANNQILIQEHKGKYYVFDNIMAESWCDENGKHMNELSLKEADGEFDTLEEAYKFASQKDRDDYFGGTEYGVQLNELCKDRTKVKIIE